MNATFRSWLKEPLLHFTLAGAVLLALSFARGEAEPLRERITLTPSDTARLEETFSRVFARPPTAEERAKLQEDYIREEIHVREALRLGLDQNDPVIRNRLVQKMDLLADSLVPTTFTDADLQAHLDANRDSYTGQPLLSFEHVLMGTPRTGRYAGGPDTLPEGSADLPASMTRASPRQIAARFGQSFADSLLALAPGDPPQRTIQSSFGAHLVTLTERIEPKPPTVERLRDRLTTDLARIRTREAKARAFQTLRDQYDVVIEESPLESALESPAE